MKEKTMVSWVENIDDRVWKMAEMSPRARSRLDSEYYRLDIDDQDDLTSEIVQQEIFRSVVEDMMDIGLTFTCDISEIYENSFYFQKTIQVLSWIFPNTFFMLLRKDTVLQQAIKNIIQGGISEESSIDLYLKFLGGENGHPGYIHNLFEGTEFLLHKIQSNDIFDKYLNSLIIRCDESHSHTLPADTMKEYHDSIIRVLKKVYDAVAITDPIVQKYRIENERIYNRQRYAQQYINQTNLLSDAGYIFSTSRNNLNDADKPFYDLIQLRLFSGWKLRPEYFSSRKNTMSRLDIIGCSWSIYALSDLSIDVINESLEKLSLYKDTSVTEDFISDLKDIYRSYLMNLYKEHKN